MGKPVPGWEALAARTAGSILALASAPGGDGVATLFAATAAGVHRSQDGGTSWTALGLGHLGSAVGVVAPSPAYLRDTTLFVGAATGLYRSQDGGATWQLVVTGSRVLSVALSPDFEQDRLLFVGTETDGVLRSDDGGARWASANPGLVDLTVLAVALSPGFTTDRTGFAATVSGVYRTRNGGKAWRPVELGAEEPAVQCLTLSPLFSHDGLVLAGTEGDGLLESRDGGASWQSVAALGRQGVAAVAVAADPRTMAAATLDGVALSRDAGATWRTLRPPDDRGQPAPVLSLLFVDGGHGHGEVLLAGRSRLGLAVIDVATGDWTSHGHGLRGGLVVALAVSAEGPRHTLWTGSLEAGAEVSRDGGAGWSPANDGLPDSVVLDLAVASGGTGTIYAATPDGLFARPEGEGAWHWLAEGPVRKVAAGLDTDVVLAAYAAGALALSTDRGASWQQLACLDGEVVSLAVSPGFGFGFGFGFGLGRDPLLLAGTSSLAADGSPGDLVLWRSGDAGQRWQRILVRRGPSALPIAVASDGAGRALLFAGAAGRVLAPLEATELSQGERRPLWRGPEVGLPGGPHTVTALAVATRASGAPVVVVAGTTGGVALSADGGATFTPWSQGLESAPVVALAAAPGVVYAALLGGTIWRRATGA